MATRFQYLKISKYWQESQATRILYSAVGNVISTTTQENNLAIAYKIEYEHTLQPSRSITVYIPVCIGICIIYIIHERKYYPGVKMNESYTRIKDG